MATAPAADEFPPSALGEPSSSGVRRDSTRKSFTICSFSASTAACCLKSTGLGLGLSSTLELATASTPESASLKLKQAKASILAGFVPVRLPIGGSCECMIEATPLLARIINSAMVSCISK